MWENYGLTLLGTTALLWASVVVPAQAAVALMEPSVFTIAHTVGGATHSSSTTGTSTVSDGRGTATITAELQPIPHMTASASVSVAEYSAGADGTVLYEFAIVGPSETEVPVIVTAKGAVTPAASTPNVALLTIIESSISPILSGVACLSNEPSNCEPFGVLQPSFSIATAILLESNTPYTVLVRLAVHADTFSGASSDSVSGFIDPIFTIDPNFALA